MTKMTALTENSSPATEDLIVTTDDPSGTPASRKVTISNLLAIIDALTQTLTNKTIDGDNNTISNLAHGSEVDNPTSGVHGATGSIVGTTDTQTLTNKTLIASSNVISEITTVASDATPNPTGGSLKNYLDVTALAAAAELQAPSGTPADKNLLMVRWKDDGTGRALTYNAIFEDTTGDGLASTTTASKVLRQLFEYSSAASKWQLIAQVEEG